MDSELQSPMMNAQNLTGVWSGHFSYALGLLPSVSFVAPLIDSGGAICGTVHEQRANSAAMLFAAVDGSRHGASVQFVKTYEGGKPHARPIAYQGTLNAEATQIDGQ